MVNEGEEMAGVVRCVHCKGEIPGDASRCMHCGQLAPRAAAARFSDQVKLMVACGAVGLAVLVSGWVLGRGEDRPTLSEAFCADLEAGVSARALVVQQDLYDRDEFPDQAYGMAALSCPEQLVSNEKLRDYLQDNGINPDA